MKKLSGLIIVLLVLILGGTWVAGKITEKELKSAMLTMNNMDHNKGFTTSLSDYKRGWFKSTATLDWKVQVPEQTETTSNQEVVVIPPKELEFHLPITIHHGPIIFANNTVKFGLGYADTEIKLPAEYDKQFNELFTESSEKPKLDISILVNYLRHSKINFTIPAFKATTKDNTIFVWKGFSSILSISRDANYLDGSFTLQGTELISQNGNKKVIVGKFQTDYDLNKAPETFFVGSTNINLDSVQFLQGEKTTFSLKDFRLDSDSSIDNHLFSAHVKTGLDKISIDNIEYGPGKLSISVRNLDADALVRIHNKLNELQKNGNVQNQQMMMAMLPEIPALLSKQPEFKISDLEFKMPEGDIKGNLTLSIPAGENHNPLLMIQNLNGNGKLSVPAAVLKSVLTQSYQDKPAAQPELQNALVSELQKDNANANPDNGATQKQITEDTRALAIKEADDQINKMLQSGLIIASDKDYVIEFGLEKGKLIINGKPFTPEMVKF